jgi:transposase
MFIRTVKNSLGQKYQQVVESYRNEEGKVRQRILLSLGKAEDGNAEKLLAVLAKNQNKLTAIGLADSISVSETFILGPLLMLASIFESTGINKILSRIQSEHEKLELDFKKIIFTLVVSRFVNPCSKLKVFEHWQHRFFSKMLTTEIHLHQMYRALDLLSENKLEIEKFLYWVDRDLLNLKTEVVLYDLTTLRFESTVETEDLRRFGYSKEKRSDCTQVVFGLLLNTDGIPLGFDVYPGSTCESTTIESIVEKVKNKFSIERIILVADRGLFSAKNLELLRKNKGEFIVGHKLGSLSNQEKEEVYDIRKFLWIVEDELAILEKRTPAGDRLIITWSRSRAVRDEKTRSDIIRKIELKLIRGKSSGKKFVSNTNYKKFLNGLEQSSPVLNQEAIDIEKKKDGFFGIVTNIETMSAKEIVTNYKQLWKIEDAFGEMKGTLKTRPVFHWTDNRILGHLTLCFISYYCEAMITKKLREKNIVLTRSSTENKLVKQRPLTVVEALKDLVEVRAIPVKVQNQTIWVRTDITGNAASILSAIGAKIPPRTLLVE